MCIRCAPIWISLIDIFILLIVNLIWLFMNMYKWEICSELSSFNSGKLIFFVRFHFQLNLENSAWQSFHSVSMSGPFFREIVLKKCYKVYFPYQDFLFSHFNFKIVWKVIGQNQQFLFSVPFAVLIIDVIIVNGPQNCSTNLFNKPI